MHGYTARRVPSAPPKSALIRGAFFVRRVVANTSANTLCANGLREATFAEHRGVGLTPPRQDVHDCAEGVRVLRHIAVEDVAAGVVEDAVDPVAVSPCDLAPVAKVLRSWCWVSVR
jgi:hypothetical protein